MPIPTSREDLSSQLTLSHERLAETLKSLPKGFGKRVCVDSWTVKDLLAVRCWWAEAVVNWIKQGRNGEKFSLPAEGYSWKETPRLNQDIVRKHRRASLKCLMLRWESAHTEVCALIDSLSDRELLEPRVFPWAGKHPISRWIALNTVRQNTTARTHIRRAVPGSLERNHSAEPGTDGGAEPGSGE